MNLPAFGNFPTAPTYSSGFPVLGVPIPKSTAFNIGVSRDNLGRRFDLTGSFAATLPPVSGGSIGAPIWFHFHKRDGSGVCTIACSGSDTFASGSQSVNLYQEDATFFTFGDVWHSPPGGRQRGWISIGTTTIASPIASLLLSTAFTDPELSQHLIDYWNVTKASSSAIMLRVSKAATVDTGSNYFPNGVFGDGSGSAATARNAATFFQCDGGSSNPTTAKNAGQILIRNPTSTTVTNATIRVDGCVLGTATNEGFYSKIEGYNGTAGAIDGLQFSASTGNLTAGTFVQQALRL